ncbi:porin [Paraburkholderia sp. SIMBA_055]|uniref:Outer membrane porin, OmpC family n=1 Tax=Paraburkholderia graminis (strain ATCC 700544 / DSM 17151 / LMG 18924 / NCIMB 13744 / C4D1M) TaxID=396598 RepID=B1FY32_PARG4|nr:MULTISPECIES: porin [Paraburkholderia]ALE56448.1 porin [Burkholderia sp. HB1]MBW8836225.1 porin [Burkholderia sp.]AXF07244.1 porin [Paraburkholderia graminis]EDT11358.1 outer membrane porin, OmpC family [Paraburkholderia graminis C4D1M]MDQ0622216.1 putative porin [Paraburkholderia graminis]
MKKALLAAALMSAGVVAHAQSSVTLYGRLDAGLEYISGLPNANYTGSTSRFRAESGDWGTSLWGMKGVEDIGGGNKVLFQLEGSFNTMNGQGPGGGGLFNRWATVGLSNSAYGTLTMGRMLFISNGVWDFDPFGQSNWSSASLVRGRNWPQSSNNIAYQSPKFYGFDVYGQYALSNATNWNGNGTTPQGREAGLQVTYTSSLFQLRGMYDEIRNNTNGNFTDPFTASREYTAAFNVFLGQFKIQGAYQAVRTSAAASAVNAAPTSLDHEWGGVTWQATPAAALIAAVYHVNANKGGGNATIYTIGGSYNLSKRTLLDIQVATVRNSKSANFGLDANNAGRGGNITASDGTVSYNENPLPGHSQTGVYAGIQHSF